MLTEMASLDAGLAPEGIAAARGWCFGWLAPVASFALHAGLVAAVALHAPRLPAAEMARGGAALEIELAVAGDQDQVASESGAAVAPPPLPRDPTPELALATVPSAEAAPTAEAAPSPEVVLPPEAAPELQPQPQPAVAPLRLAAPRRAHERKPPRHKKSEEHQAALSRQAGTRGGSGGVTASAGADTMASYRARVIAHLTRYKDYPEPAQERGITGRNSVTITLTRDGRAVASAVSGSGHAVLDAATLAAVRRAQPFPPMPAGSPATLTLTIGLNYRLH